jgi:hypothetical protein
MAPFFYGCDYFGCEYSDTCVECFRKKYPNWKILESEWRYFFLNKKFNEYDVRLVKNI